ncbi:hypothetical protein AB0A70_00665 [Streptomyces morookaense]
MTAVAVEITARPEVLGAEPEPVGVVIVDDVEALAAGSTPGCNNDNPYR